MIKETVIKIENLSKRYQIGQRLAPYRTLKDMLSNFTMGFSSSGVLKSTKEYIWALKDINLEIKKGEIVGIIGRNGAGKSTLLKILSRITEPTEGRVIINGKVGSLLEVGTGFHPELTGRENIYLNGAILGMKKAEISNKLDEIIAFSEIEKFIDTPIKFYSSGMYVRLAFAVAAHLEADIMLVDEVLAVGDLAFQKKCLGKMENVAKGGRTVLFISHNMGSISALCNKCILLDGGKIKLFDTPQKAISDYTAVGDKRSTVEIEPFMRSKGDGSITFRDCSIMDTSGNFKKSFLIKENIQVCVSLESNFTGNISFWLLIFDSTGTPLLSSHQRDGGVAAIREGRFKLSYQTKNLGLMPGNYFITAGAFDTRLKFLEWVDKCQTFEVLPCFVNGTAYDNRWGAVNQEAVWSLKEDEQ